MHARMHFEIFGHRTIIQHVQKCMPACILKHLDIEQSSNMFKNACPHAFLGPRERFREELEVSEVGSEEVRGVLGEGSGELF